MTENLLLVFTRNPVLGRCKTRLAKTVGNENALAIYKILLKHTGEELKELAYDTAVYYSEEIIENDLLLGNNHAKFIQNGDDLGLRMFDAFKNSFRNGYKKVVIIGCDIIDLKAKHISQAFDALDNNDVVMGPAEDGGYYLLGMNELHRSVFLNKDWGTESVREQTLRDLLDQKIAILEMLNDIDVYEDLKGHLPFSSYLKPQPEISLGKL
jgi:rSAM/selenodomain-associated transferase 1